MPWYGDRFSAEAQGALVRGLDQAAEFLLSKAVPRTPVETSALRHSGQVHGASATDLESVVSFDTPYAVKQHNDTLLRHAEGGANYLGGPAIEEQDTIYKIIAKPIGNLS
jgi:hypothetical protein